MTPPASRMSVITDWRIRDESELPDLLPGENVERVIAPQKFVVLHQIILRGPYLLRLRIGAVLDVPFELVNVDGKDRRYRPKDLDQKSIKSQLVTTGAPAVGPNAIALPPGIDWSKRKSREHIQQQGDHLMPRHKQVTTCRRGGGPVSKMCSCEHCCLDVCEVCGGAEGTLTTDCPGTKVAYDRHQEVFETTLDYTDERGWHVARNDDGSPNARRSPRFEDTTLPPEPPRPDPRAVVAPSIDWAAVDHITDLKHELSLRAIAWVLADRVADDHSATLTRIEDETAVHLPKGQEPNAQALELLKTLEYEKIGFRLANQSAEKCNDEFRQAARKLVAALEAGQVATTANDKMLFTRTCGCTVIAGAACPHFAAART